MRRAIPIASAAAALACCAHSAPFPDAIGKTARVVEAPPAVDASIADAGPETAAVRDAPTEASAFSDDAMALHYDDPLALVVLLGDAASAGVPMLGPFRLGQGNRAVSRHSISRRACLDALRDVVMQTPEQRSRCGADSMLPVWSRGGNTETARFCIDAFEFPNRACELPFVFVTPAQAARLCGALGKRLCTQEEWSLACRGDPDGGPDRLYAYGDDLDLAICDTNKSRASGPACDLSTSEKLWSTCGTNTEPSGAFPRCRSRFGVFDQHGNVAEIMTRFEPADGFVYSQLKGSAFFYVDVAKRPSDPGGYWSKYPDHCDFDPRWHVERIETAQHMNYHLGFRCCKTLAAQEAGAP